MHERPLVNITMPTFNRLELTRQAIEALARHTGHPHHLTVVDNASTDGTADYLREQKDRGLIQTLLLLERNMGVACAANAGWAAVDSPLYMKLDNDIAVTRDGWLDDLVAVSLRNPGLAALAYPARQFAEAVPVLMPGSGDPVLQAPHVSGECILIRRDIHEKLGFWCEDYGLYGEEDSDFGNRATRAGLASAYLPDFSAIRTLDVGTVSPYLDIKVRAARRRNIEQFLTNTWAYRTGLRPLFMPRKYTQEIKGERVVFGLDQGYQRAQEAWNSHKKAVAETNRDWIEDYVAGRR